MLDKKGQISAFRISVLAVGVGLLFIVGAVVYFYADRAAHQVPLEIEVYPGALNLGEVPHSDTSRTVVYRADGATAEQVMAHYQNKMSGFYGASSEPEFSKCKRFPSVGNFPEFDAGNKTVAPYQFTCLFDASGFFLTQTTAVMIQPGVGEQTGATMIAYEQTWQS